MGRIEIYILAAVVIGCAIYFYKKYKDKKEKEMPQGLQIFDGNGNIILDFTSKTMKVYGTVSTGTEAGTFTDYRIDPNNFFIMPIKMDLVLANGSPGHVSRYRYFAPRVTVSAGQIKWDIIDEFSDRFGEYYPSYRVDFTFIYGGFE